MSNQAVIIDGQHHSPDYERRLREALWCRGSLDWKLYDYQKPVYQAIRAKGKEPQNVFVLHIARRWGKSFILSIIALEDCLTTYNAVVKYCASSAKQIKEFIVPMMQEILKDCPKKLRPKFNKASLTYTFPKSNSVLILHGLDEGRAEGVRGAKSDKTIIDEAGFVDNLSYVVKSILFPMTLTTKGQTILSSNSPLTPEHDFCQVFTPEAIATGSYLKKTIFDNGSLTKEDIDRTAAQYGGYTSSDFRREFMCEFELDKKSAIVPEFIDAREAIVVKTIERPLFFKPFVSLDLGFNDGTGVVFGYFDFARAKIVIQDEYLVRGQNSETITQVCRAKEHALWGDPDDRANPGIEPLRFADGQPLVLAGMSTTHKYPVNKTNNTNLEAGVNTLRLAVQAHTIEIHEKCKQIIHQCATGIWDKSKKHFARPAEGNHFDLLAALVYFLRHVPKSNPFPPGYGFNPSTMQAKHLSHIRPEHQAWANLLGAKRR